MLTKDPAKVGRLNEHLARKIEDHRAEIELVEADLQPGARALWISYGITARAMREAASAARRSGKRVSALTLRSLWPVPEAALLAAAFEDGVEHVVVAELNQGQYCREVERLVYGHAARNRLIAPVVSGIDRVDGELIAPDQFIERGWL